MERAEKPERIGRYRVVDLLGEGATGHVYSVEDEQSKTLVALKVLRSDAWRTADLKREFRLAAELGHRNLVLPYALETDGRAPFFTMELIEGKPILEWLAPELPPERVRQTFLQLADGLGVLHKRGLVHRDLKPTNILVEDSGRVAILDFGLTRRVATKNAAATNAYLAGTPAYLAPELLAGDRFSPASDAYAVGILLHQALTGRLPFDDDIRRSVFERRLGTKVRALCSEPGDLWQLCERLLEPDPSKRCTMHDVVTTLNPARLSLASFAPLSVLVERDVELEKLDGAYRALRDEQRITVVHLPGRSGMGKTMLLREFARRLDRTAWVLEGRAYEHDAVPYKALDAAIDQLAQRLWSRSDAEIAELLPADADALDDLFPVLGNALRVQRSRDPVADPHARRRRGTRALRDLLGLVSHRFGLVIMLDDLHWGDLDSARLLADVLASPAPQLLLLLAYRSEHVESPFLSHYRRWEADNLKSHTVPVRPLSQVAAVRMAKLLSGDNASAGEIAAQSDGCPFIVEMLLSAPRPTGGTGLTLQEAIAAQVAALSRSGREMLEAICVAGRPISRGRVPHKPSPADEIRQSWALLVGSRLVRSQGSSTSDLVEPYHDRIREAITDALSPESLHSIHLALGESYASGAPDAEGAALHLAAAGEKSRAVSFARTAAASAAEALAFDRQASFLALALECSSAMSPPEQHALAIEHARALASAGQGGRAAPALLKCSAEATGADAIDLRREAMEQFLIAGHVDDGEPVMLGLLRELGVWKPKARWLLNLAIVVAFVRLLIRGPALGKPRRLSHREQLLLDVYGSLGKGYASYDAALGTWFFLRAAQRALDWGQSTSAVRGVAYMASLLGFSGSESGTRRARHWVEAGEAWAKDDGHSLAFCKVARGMIECCAGEWLTSIHTFDAAAKVLDERFAGSAWEADIAKNTPLFALVQLGDMPEVQARTRVLTQEARERGDLALEVESNLYDAFVALGRDEVVDAHRCIERNEALWTANGYHFQHWIALRFRTMCYLYEGRTAEALLDMAQGLRKARSASLTAMQVVRIEGRDLHGRAAFGCAQQANGPARNRLVRLVQKDVKLLLTENRPHAIAPAEMLRAGLALLAGDRRAATAHLEQAQRAYECAGMRTSTLAARWHCANLNELWAERRTIENALQGCGIRQPGRWTRMHLSLIGHE